MTAPLPDPSVAPGPSRRLLLSSAIAAAAAAALPPGAQPAAAAPVGDPGRGAGSARRATAGRPDRELRTLLREVDHRRIEATVRRLAAFGTRHTLSSQTDPVRGIGAARDWLLQQMKQIEAGSGGRFTSELQSYVQQPASRIPVATTITNVVGTLKGTASPERFYVLAGHYDSRATDVDDFTSDAPGADDDASGVAVLLELARVMSKRPTEGTIVFAAVSGEEQGLYGSTYLAQQMKAAGKDVQGMITNDIIGSPKGDEGVVDRGTVRLFAEGVPSSETAAEAARRRSVGGENDSPTRQWARYAEEVNEGIRNGLDVRIIYRRDRYLRGGDHIPFLERAYPAVRFTEPREDFAHQHQDVRVVDGVQYGDLPEFCDFRYIADVARVNGATLWTAAQAPGTPKGARLLTNRLTNETDIVWDRGPEADLSGYEVVYRETTSPTWDVVVPVGDVTAVTLDISKDNVFFGVRAVDEAGHRSPVAFPR